MFMFIYRSGLTKIICLTLTLAFLMLQFMLADFNNNQAQAAETGLFADVTEDNPNYAYINYLANQKIISGFPDGTYHPQEGVTRAQAAFLLVKVLGLNLAEVTESGFSDVSADHWAFAAIGTAVKAGYLQGYPDGTFRLEQPISRAEGIALALRLSKSELPAVALPPLADVSTDHWAAPQISAALDAGLISRADNTHFAPDAALSRAAVARAFALMMVLAPEYQAATLAGALKPVKGTVKLKSESEASFQTVTKQVTLKVGDTIMTEANSAAEVTFDDGTALRIEPNTQLVITKTQGVKYIKKSGQAGTAVDLLGIDLKRGEIFGGLAAHGEEPAPAEGTTVVKPQPQVQSSARLASSHIDVEYPSVNVRMAEDKQELPWWKKPREQKVRVEVNMPWGVCGIRGTFCHAYVGDSGESGVDLLTGSAILTSDGEQAMIQAGQKAVIDSKGEITTDTMQAQDYQNWTQPEVQDWANRTANNIDNNAPAAPDNTPETGETSSEEENNEEPGTQSDKVSEALSQAAASTSSPPSTPSQGGGGGGGGDSPPPTIVSISEQKAVVSQDSAGSLYQLPATVDAQMSNGATQPVAVSWNTPTVDLSKAGVYKYEGTVSGYNQNVIFELVVEAPLGVAVPIAQNVPLAFDGGIRLDFRSINIPPDATVTVKKVNNPDIEGSGLRVAGMVIDITYEGNIDFSQGVKITLPYNKETDESRIAIFYFNEKNGNWEYQDSQVGNGVVEATVYHLSIFGVFDGLVEAPTADPVPGSVKLGSAINLSTATPGAIIYYTTDGNDPTVNSPQFAAGGEPTVPESGLTIKAFAAKPGMRSSAIVTFVYTVGKGKLVGRVQDEAGQGLAGVTVSLSKNDVLVQEVTTTDTGEFVFEDVLADDGYTLTFTKPGYHEATSPNIEIEPDTDNNLEPVIMQTVINLPIPVLPAAFYGTVSINGQPASEGTAIIAKVVKGSESEVVGKITVNEGGKFGYPEYGGPKLIVGAAGNIEPGATIEFWVVYGEEVDEKAYETEFQPGAIQELNLQVGTAS